MSSFNATFKLNNGDTIPVIGLGTWNSNNPQEVKNSIIDAVKAGYRHIDCAPIYRNEKEIGQALEELFKDGIVKRSEMFITTKLWCNCHSEHLVKPAIEDSLKNLKLDYVDLYLIHWPMAFEEGDEHFPTKQEDGKTKCIDVDYLETWKGMEKINKLGLAKAIGVSNFNHEQLDRIIDDCDIPPAMNQIECHPYLSQNKLLTYCNNMNISVTAYSPLGSPGSPFNKTGDPTLLDDEKLISIAKKYNKSVAQVALRFQIDRGVVVIPKSFNKERIEANINIFDFKLSPEDIKVIEGLNKNHRYIKHETAKHSTYYPFNIEY